MTTHFEINHSLLNGTIDVDTTGLIWSDSLSSSQENVFDISLEQSLWGSVDLTGSLSMVNE